MTKSLPDRLHLELECILTESEVRAASKALVEVLAKQDLIRERLAEEKQKVKAELALLDGQAGRLRGMVRRERETREVLCEISYNWKGGEKYFTRMDTGEVARVEKITMTERQREIE